MSQLGASNTSTVAALLERCGRLPIAGMYLRPIIGTLCLIRFINLIGIAIIALGSALWAGKGIWPAEHIIGFVLGYVFIAAGGYAINDVADVDIDRIAHPNRPLVLSALSTSNAWLITVLCFAVGILFQLSLGPVFWILSPSLVAALVIYSMYLKARSGVLANLLVAVLVASVPLSAALKANAFDGLLAIAFVGFGVCFAREILKDAEDELGDRAAGRRTLVTTSQHTLAKAFVVLGILGAAGASILLVLTLPASVLLVAVMAISSGVLLLGLAVWAVAPRALPLFQMLSWCAMYAYAIAFLCYAVSR